jgi:hypothetical protein
MAGKKFLSFLCIAKWPPAAILYFVFTLFSFPIYAIPNTNTHAKFQRIHPSLQNPEQIQMCINFMLK